MAASFFDLTPEHVLEFVDSLGLKTTGRYLQLNSFENRVFDVFLESEDESKPGRIVPKFYRPGRWSKECTQEEHDFLAEIHKEGIPVTTALSVDKQTLFDFHGIWAAAFTRISGRCPDEILSHDARSIGRILARLHNVGSQKPAKHRQSLNADEFGYDSLDILKDFVAPEVWPRYKESAERICEVAESVLDPTTFIRIHGDCHRGNLIYDTKEFSFVDFDDFINGPVAQDFWMLTQNDELLLDNMIEGYQELRSFDESQLDLFLPLQGIRIIHYAAWIAKRWTLDASFKMLFPNFENYSYWASEVESIEAIAWKL